MRGGSYDKHPFVEIAGHQGEVWKGYDSILTELRSKLSTIDKKQKIIVIDCYPGVLYRELKSKLIDCLEPKLSIFTDDEIFQSAQEITDRVRDRMTDDRVFGQMCLENYEDLVKPDAIKCTNNKIERTEGTVVIYGAGARMVCQPDVYIYADMARWNLQLRLRSNRIRNWKNALNYTDNLMKFKWGYFFEWRIADRHKKRHFDELDYILDTNIEEMPKLLSGNAFRDGLQQAVRRPFRVVPFFDPGVWGGQWMKQVCGLDAKEKNYAWCFDCVPEENSLLLKLDGELIEIPSLDLVLRHPRELLGDKVYARFGAEFPIRFDFLDTWDGQNLSLQVHPLISYIQDKFGMHYTQEESYYILDAKEDSHPVVYLGLKNGVQKEDFLNALEKAQDAKFPFDAEKYVNRIPVKKHDHVMIPPGTVHCSGKNTMVLEISSTPYIFTFKLWDWGRVGLDGKPRPIHLEHGKEVIQFERDTDFVERELIHQEKTILKEEGHETELTGLHKLELIESRREWFTHKIKCKTADSVNVLNLVEGEEITVESVDGTFAPFQVHYAETFIIPETVKEYWLVPQENTRTGVVCTRVRTWN